MVSADKVPAVAAALIDDLYDPKSLVPWFVDPSTTGAFLHERGVPPELMEQLAPLLPATA
jgi:hypothetical protein